ncbi:MAG: YbjN domain-containing protein [Atopobiaceae bacterium]|nr:YbjN domain-containing protein [Atopobiaceae bacterium]
MATGAETKQIVLAYLDEQGIRYSDRSDERVQCVHFGWTTRVMSDIQLDLFFDDNGETIHLATMLPLMVPEDKLAMALVEVNRCNKQYRWIDFYLDDDSTIMGEIDAVVEPSTAGAEILQLIQRTLGICDDAYPKFMRLIWG